MRKRSVILAVTHEQTAQNFYRGYLGFLQTRGWDPTIVASSAGALEEFAAEEGISSHSISMRRDPAPFQDMRSLVQWVRYLKRSRPDVLVAATPKASLLSLVAAWITRIPVRVYQMWGLRLETESGVRRIVLHALERVTAASATHVVCNSRSLANAARREGILGSKEATVLGEGSSHGVDVEYFSLESDLPDLSASTRDFLASNPEDVVIGFVGRVQADKGLDVLLEALKLCTGRPGARISCIVVGGSEDEGLLAELEAATAQLPLHLAGRAVDPRPYMQVFDILCLPSRREGFPNVVLEAAAMGVPAIVSDATGAVDSVVNDVTGLVVETGRADLLADAIMELSNDVHRREEMGLAARQRAAEHFSREHIWDLQEAELSRAHQNRRRTPVVT